MTAWLYLLLLPPLVPLIRDDFRTRRVSLVWLMVLGCACAAVGWTDAGAGQMGRHAAVNTFLLALFMGAMALCHRIRRGTFRDFFNIGLGAGDVVMMGMLVPLFAPDTYVRFLLVACLVALVWWFFRRSATIPLAGIMAWVLAGYSLIKILELWS